MDRRYEEVNYLEKENCSFPVSFTIKAYPIRRAGKSTLRPFTSGVLFLFLFLPLTTQIHGF